MTLLLPLERYNERVSLELTVGYPVALFPNLIGHLSGWGVFKNPELLHFPFDAGVFPCANLM